MSVWSLANEQLANSRLEGVQPTKQAWYDSGIGSEIQRRQCTPNTRQSVLTELRDWINDPEGVRIYWMNGMAGTGKTTIAFTLCTELEKAHRLAASFFCTRESPDCRDVRRILPTIAYQLARFSPAFKSVLCQILGNNPDLGTRGVATQFQELISKPLLQVTDAIPADLVVVLDALDECSDPSGAQLILDALLNLADKLSIRFFITCRPEHGLLGKLLAYGDLPRSVFHLHDMDRSVVQADIETYFRSELLPTEISSDQVKLLADRAGNLFIYASTVVRYIRPSGVAVDTLKRLSKILEPTANASGAIYKGVDALYTSILSSALNNPELEAWEIDNIRLVLHTVICAVEPMSIEVLAKLLNLDSPHTAQLALEPLKSVLHVPEGDGPVLALHASFAEYILNQSRSRELFCDQSIHSSLFTQLCFGTMQKSLRFNICDLESSFVLDADVPDLQNRVARAILPHLFYACQHWSDYLCKATTQKLLVPLLEQFLSWQLPFWVEVLNLKQSVSTGIVMLSKTQAWLQAHGGPAYIRTLCQDALVLVTIFAGNAVSQSTPHLYVSIMPFWGKERLARPHYGKNIRSPVSVKGPGINPKGAAALAVWSTNYPISSLIISSSGPRFASGLGSGSLDILDAQSGGVIARLVTATSPIKDIAISPDDIHITISTSDDKIQIYNTQTGVLVAESPGRQEGSIDRITYSPDGSRLVSSSSNRTILVWNTRSATVVKGPLAGHTGSISSLFFLPDGSHFVSGSYDGTFRIWHADTGICVAAPLASVPVECAALSSSGADVVFAGGPDYGIYVSNLWTGASVAGPFMGHFGRVVSVGFSPDDALIVSGSDDRTIRIWDKTSENTTGGVLEGHNGQVTSVTFSSDSTSVVSSSIDGTIRVWGAHGTHIVSSAAGGHTNWVNSVAFSPDSSQIVSGSSDCTIRIWDAQKGVSTHDSLVWSDPVKSVAFSPDASRVASGSSDGTVCIWDAHDGSLLAGPFKGHTGPISSVEFSPDSACVASGSEDGSFRIWNTQSGDLVAGPFDWHMGEVSSVAFSPDGVRIASGSWDTSICIWDIQLGEIVVGPFVGHQEPVCSVAFSRDGARLVSGSQDGSILVWDTQFGKPVAGPFTGHTGRVGTVVFSSDGAQVVSGSKDRTIRVWDAWCGTLIRLFEGHAGEVHSVAFSPDGNQIVSGSKDQVIRIWGERNVDEREDGDENEGAGEWSVNSDGWLVSQSAQLLLWVPSDLRVSLKRPQNLAVVFRRGYIELSFDEAIIGPHWKECYLN
ncbi:hypothetical protein FRC12_004601 [Ceratobasidium sp. 428]|nr:hypothetical protein FRC12_004601 [Ceratobasidium sp. 428]